MEQQRHDAQAALSRLTATLRERYPACEAAFLLGDPAEQVAGLAHDLHADLIVTASHHPSFLARLLNLDQAPKIMHRAPCPVLVYHEDNQTRITVPSAGPEMQTAGSEKDAPRKRILVPVDLTAEPGPTLNLAVKLAREWKTDLYVLNVYATPAYVANSHYIYAVQGVGWRRRQFQDRLLEWVEHLQKAHPRTFALFEDGECAATGIREVAAKLPADLIVVSTHNRTWLSKWLLYSDADEVVRKASAPVLVMRGR